MRWSAGAARTAPRPRPRVGHPSRVPRGHRKTQGGQPQKILPAALFVTEPTSQNSRVFSRACKKSPQRRRLTRRRRAKSAAQRDFRGFWALQGQNHTAARHNLLRARGADPPVDGCLRPAGRPEGSDGEARGVRTPLTPHQWPTLVRAVPLAGHRPLAARQHGCASRRGR